MSFNQKEFNNFIIDNNVIGFFQDPITLKSGRVSHFYVNWRDVFSDVFSLEKVVDFVIDFTKDLGLNPDCFYGVPEGATKIALVSQYKWAKESPSYVQGAYCLPMGRAKPKEHGDVKDKFFIGNPKGKTIVIEDTTTTGESLINTLLKLQKTDVEIMAVFGLTNRMEKREDNQSVKQAIESFGAPYYSMSNATELIPLSYEKLAPTQQIKDAIGDYFQRYGVEELN